MKNLRYLEKTLNLWKMPDLSLMRRILIVKSLGISKFIYTAAVTEINEIIINKIENMIYNFIWRDKKAKIRRKTLIGKYTSGGLQAPDINSIINAQRIMWIK